MKTKRIRWGHRDVNPHIYSGSYPDLPLILGWKSGTISKGQFYQVLIGTICCVPYEIEERILNLIVAQYPEIERILDEYFDKVLEGREP